LLKMIRLNNDKHNSCRILVAFIGISLLVHMTFGEEKC